MYSRHQALITGLVLLFGLSAAACATAPPASSAMKLGAQTSAPVAFVDFCRRQPAECAGSKEASAVAATLALVDEARGQQAEAMRRTWQAVFARNETPAGATATFATASLSDAPDWSALLHRAANTATSASSDWDAPTGATGATARFDWAPIFAQPGTPPPGADAAPVRQADAIDLSHAPALDAALWARLNRVNVKINRAIVRSTDAAAYGVEELWSLPLENGQKYGDCEDYVLEKRLALIAEGVPMSALSIAVVQTGEGEGHAVLVVTTDKGEYVLDNQTPWIVPWTQTPYRWVARQTAGGPFSWALIADS